MPIMLKSLIPWILFFSLFGQFPGSIKVAAIIAFVSHLIFNYKSIKRLFVLDVGGLIFFLLFSINAFIFKSQVISNNGYLISNLAIALIAWVSLIIQRPFTLQYARLEVSYEISVTPLFSYINYILTGVWAIVLTLMAVPNVIELYDPITYASGINIVSSIILVLIGVWFTKVIPDWLSNKMITKRFNIDIKKIYATEKSKHVISDKFNEEKISNSFDMETEVIIIGAGPIGLTSALALQQHGVSVIILEKHVGTSIHPKARSISCRSVELFRRLGIETEIVQQNLPRSDQWFGWFSQLTGILYAKITKKTDYSLVSSCDEASTAQQYLERILLNRFIAQGGKILFKHEVLGLAQDTKVVQVEVKDREVNQNLFIQGQYLIASDGSRSLIRELLKIPMLGPETISVNFSVYCEIDLDEILTEGKRFGIAYVVRPGKPAPMVLAIDGKKKWIFIFPSAGASAKALENIYTDEYVKQQIIDVIGSSDFPIRIINKQAWSMGAQVANQFHSGRTFLAGDSMHRFPPTGGMGMNTGLQDVDNLIWKMALVIKNKAQKSLLQSYTTERLQPILNAMSWSLENLSRIVRTQRDLEGKDLKSTNLQNQVQEQDAHLNKSGLDLGVIYASDLISKSSELPPEISTDQYIPSTYPGSRLPHFELICNGKMLSSLDLVSASFILLHFTHSESFITALDFKNIPTQLICIDNHKNIKEVRSGQFASLLDLDEFAGLWVRPDGHIAWKGCLNNIEDLKKLDNIIVKIST